MDSIFTILFAAIDGGYADATFVREWADRLILKAKYPQEWLINLSLSRDEDNMLKVLRKSLLEHRLRLGYRYCEIYIGFLYLRYKQRRLTYDKFMALVIDTVDAEDFSVLDLYRLIALSKRVRADGDTANFEFEEKFEAFGADARKLFDYLESEDFYEREMKNIDVQGE